MKWKLIIIAHLQVPYLFIKLIFPVCVLWNHLICWAQNFVVCHHTQPVLHGGCKFSSTRSWCLICRKSLIMMFLFSDAYVECQLTYNDMEPRGCYTELHPGVLRSCTLNVVPGGRAAPLTPPVIMPMLAYTQTSAFDPFVPHTDLTSLGYVRTYVIKNFVKTFSL